MNVCMFMIVVHPTLEAVVYPYLVEFLPYDILSTVRTCRNNTTPPCHHNIKVASIRASSY